MENEKHYFFFTGYYEVAKASDMLSRYHIKNRIVKAPINKRNSCAFTVMVDKQDEEMSRFIIERGK